MKNAIVKFVEFFLVLGVIVAWHLVGQVVPSFGWFLEQPVVMGTLSLVAFGFGVRAVIAAYEYWLLSSQN
jgi:hypothetical protein